MVLRPTFEHRFVQFVPENVGEGVVYVSIEYTTAVHKCACGCGNQAVTPLSPTRWELTYDGEAISLFPSVGNWSFPCRSHYWIQRNSVIRSRRWTDDEIRYARGLDAWSRKRYYERRFEEDFEANGVVATQHSDNTESDGDGY
jgi:hypothetical protein